jgi:hypothetical protein
MIRNSLRQKGAILVLTALALPMLICTTGLAIDLGNIYVQCSRLQNAADAAAIAGAHAYNGETIKSANNSAKEYIKGKMHNLATDEDIHPPNYQMQSKDNVKYYRVKLEKDVPLYFLKVFYEKDTFTVPVESIAEIKTTNNILSPYMFIFSKRLHTVGTFSNPDNATTDGQIRSSFDDSIIYTDKNYEELAYNDDNKLNVQAFFTQKSVDEKLSISRALAKSAAVYDKTTGKASTNGYYHSAIYSTYDYMNMISYIENGVKSAQNDAFNAGYNLKASDINTSQKYSYVFNANADLNIDTALSGDINTPIYIEFKSGTDVTNINLSADTRRPIMIYSEGTTKIHLNLNGHTFRGIICAPKINDEGVLINANGGTFSGTITAANINLQGGTSHYKFEGFSASDSGNSSSSTTTVTLTSNPSGITWND